MQNKKNKFQELEDEAELDRLKGNPKKAFEKYIVLQNYYNLNKNVEKEKDIAKKLIKVHIDIAKHYLKEGDKEDNKNISMIKKAVYELIDAIDISQKYGYKSTVEKLYENATGICRAYKLVALENEIEHDWMKNTEKTYGNKKNVYF